eukprot:scaffold220844_cov34-Prasinocladus_malaysianus.AAC.1
MGGRRRVFSSSSLCYLMGDFGNLSRSSASSSSARSAAAAQQRQPWRANVSCLVGADDAPRVPVNRTICTTPTAC